MTRKQEVIAGLFGYFIAIVFVWIVLGLLIEAFGQEEYTPPYVPEYQPAIAEIADPKEPDCDHDSNSFERFEVIRLLPPVKIKNYDSLSLEYLHEDKYGVHVGRLFLNTETVMPKDMWKNYKGKYFWILFCDKCKHVYTIVEVSQAQMKATKKS